MPFFPINITIDFNTICWIQQKWPFLRTSNRGPTIGGNLMRGHHRRSWSRNLRRHSDEFPLVSSHYLNFAWKTTRALIVLPVREHIPDSRGGRFEFTEKEKEGQHRRTSAWYIGILCRTRFTLTTRKCVVFACQRTFGSGTPYDYTLNRGAVIIRF